MIKKQCGVFGAVSTSEALIAVVALPSDNGGCKATSASLDLISSFSNDRKA